jgi:hypothetical protein
MPLSPSSSFPSHAADWSSDISAAIELNAAGLILGQGTALMRLAKDGSGLALDTDRDRCLALLSVVVRRPVAPQLLDHVEAAAAHFERGEKALANLRLVFAGLPKLDDPADAYRLRAAEYLLDAGLSPRALMTELALDASILGLVKYDSDQPRVPPGSGRESGRWTEGADGADSEFQSTGEANLVAAPTVASNPSVQQSPKPVQVAANGPFSPAGINVVPAPPVDTLDPQGLNSPLSAEEQQAIADTFNSILTGLPEEILKLNPHGYENKPSKETGAILPPLSVNIPPITCDFTKAMQALRAL